MSPSLDRLAKLCFIYRYNKHMWQGFSFVALPDNCGHRPNTQSDPAEPSDPRSRTAEWTRRIGWLQPTHSFTADCAGKGDTAPYLHINPVLEAALRLRLHQPVAVLWRTIWFGALLSCFLFTTSCFFFCRRDRFTISSFAWVVEATIATRYNAT